MRAQLEEIASERYVRLEVGYLRGGKTEAKGEAQNLKGKAQHAAGKARSAVKKTTR